MLGCMNVSKSIVSQFSTRKPLPLFCYLYIYPTFIGDSRVQSLDPFVEHDINRGFSRRNVKGSCTRRLLMLLTPRKPTHACSRVPQ
jgi:hypothetical protein